MEDEIVNEVNNEVPIVNENNFDKTLNQSINFNFEKFKIRMELFKWLIGTVGVVAVTMFINWGFKDRSVGMAEISDYNNKFATDLIILNPNPMKRRMLAQFFANVTPSEKLKKGWEDYFEIVEIDYKAYQKQKDSLKVLKKNAKDSMEIKIIDENLKALINDEITPITVPLNLKSKQNNKTVFIQYSNKSIKEIAQNTQQIFNLNKWIAPGIDLVDTGTKFTNTIKYFHDEDRETANVANSLLDNKYKIIKASGTCPIGQIEIWISN
jgi:hypothetical protein